MTEKTDRKQKPHLFRPGQSGNPAGRPRGSGLSGELRASLAIHVPKIVEKLVSSALIGDTVAARLILDRYSPPPRAESMPVEIPGLDTGPLTERVQAALAAAGRGEVSLDTVNAAVSAITGLARVRETEELEARLTALEKRMVHKA